MKTNVLRLGLICFVSVLFCVMTGFIPEKQSRSFKEANSGLDTLTILSPVVQVVADDNKNKFVDFELAQSNVRLIDSVSVALLSKKYKLDKTQTYLSDTKQYEEVLQHLENAPDVLENVSSRQVFNKQRTACNSRYALLLFYNGQFHPNFPPHYKLNTAVFAGKVVITPNNPTQSNSDMRVLIIDTETEQIVYYDKLSTAKYDPRVQSEVMQLTKDILKNIYYKKKAGHH
jgi:hypothetical protein